MRGTKQETNGAQASPSKEVRFIFSSVEHSNLCICVSQY